MIHGMYYFSIVKFYNKLTNGHLPDYFDQLKPKILLVVPDTLSETLLCSAQIIKHEYARYKLHDQLIRVKYGNTNCISLPVNVNNSILEKVATHSISFIGYKIYAKNTIIKSYQDACILINYYVCQNSYLPQHYHLCFC